MAEFLSKEARIQRDSEMRVDNIPLKSIRDNPYQPRKKYPRSGIKLLAKSISDRGLLHPISVVRVNDHYVIVGGHRRYRAFRLLKRKTIPAIIRHESTPDDLALDLAIENAVRKDFSPAEKAQAIYQVLCTIPNVENDRLRCYTLINQVRLEEKRGKIGVDFTGKLGFESGDVYRCRKLLEKLALSANTAIKYLRLLDLPGSIQEKVIVSDNDSKDWLRRGYITISMAYELSRIKSDEIRLRLYKRVIRERIQYIHLRFIVDELLEQGEEQFRNLGKGTALSRDDSDGGMTWLSRRCFQLSSSLWNYRGKLPLQSLQMEKLIYQASLRKLRRCALELVRSVNAHLEDCNEDKLELVNQDFTLVMKAGSNGQRMYRYNFPRETARMLGVEPGDKLHMEIKAIEKGGNGTG